MVMRGDTGNKMLSRCLAVMVAVAVILVTSVPSFAEKKLVAAVLTSDIQRYRDAHRAFVRTLAQKGFDQNTTEIIVQTPNPDPISWANTIRKFEGLGADIIITYGAPITLVAMRETHQTPIVFVDVYGPVEVGISRSMTMTGKHLSGVSSKVPMITLVKTVQEFKPVKSMGILYNSREAGSLVQFQELKRVAAQQGFAVVDVNLPFPSGVESALTSLLPKVDCLYISECTVGSRMFEKIVSRANASKVPVISQMPEAAEKGALVSLEVSPAEQGQLAGECAAKILNGMKPGQIPILSPKRSS